MSDIYREFGLDQRLAGPTSVEIRMEKEIARLRVENNHLRQARAGALAGGDALKAENASLRDKLAQARNLTDKMLDGVLNHYTCMSDVRSDVYTLQDTLKD